MTRYDHAWPGESISEVKSKILRRTRACIALDDSDGTAHPSLEVGRRLWAAVIFPEPAAATALTIHHIYQQQLKDKGVTVFHFTDLWTGNGPFKGWPVEDRLQWIENFGRITEVGGLQVLIVQRSPSMIDALRLAGNELPNTPVFNLGNPDSLAFHTALNAIRKSVQNPARGGVTAVADRNAKLDGVLTVLRLEGGKPFLDWLTPPGILYSSVADFPLLQYADLAAWGYSRMELAKARGIQNDYERKLLELLVSFSRDWITIPVDEQGHETLRTLGHMNWPGPLPDCKP